LDESEGEQLREQIGNIRTKILEERASLEARLERLNSPYVVSEDLAKVLEVSRILKKPLLLEGEPGTGKTSLAYALAGEENLNITQCQCKSTTKAENMLYEIDTVQKLQDAYLAQQSGEKVDLDDRNYIKYGPLGSVIKQCADWQEGDPVPLLLIDEIDKASRDFSNDLLHEIDKMSFFVTETGEEVCARVRPIVVITSNHEKELPEPFLRRCVWHYIDFPEEDMMSEIVQAHLPNVSRHLLGSALQKFYEIREHHDIQKKPSTGEFIEWIKILLEEGVNDVSEIEPHHLGVLLKLKEDFSLFDKETKNKREKMKEEGMPPEFVEAAMDSLVIRLNGDEYGDSPDSSLYLLLANNGIPFSTPKGYSEDNDYRPFSINVAGVKNIDGRKTLKVTQEIYDLLLNNGMIKTQIFAKEAPKDFIFSAIDNANDLFIEGENQEGNDVYRLIDGRIIVSDTPENYQNYQQQLIEKEERKEEKMGSLGKAMLKASGRDRTLKPSDKRKL